MKFNPEKPIQTQEQITNIKATKNKEKPETEEQATEKPNIDKLIQDNLYLLEFFAKKFRFITKSTIISTDDLIQEGFLGLYIAAQKYKPEKGVKFSTYARWSILNRMYNYINKNSLPFLISKDFSFKLKAISRKIARQNRPLSVLEIKNLIEKEYPNSTSTTIELLLNLYFHSEITKDVSKSFEQEETSEETSNENLYFSHKQAELLLRLRQLQDRIKSNNTLNPSQQIKIFYLKYFYSYSFREIAGIFKKQGIKISHETVRRIYSKIIAEILK